MSLYLKIDQDEKFEFFEKYDTLSPLRKKIWQKIVVKVNQWPVCQPRQGKIAEWCKCSRSAVSEAFKIFKKWGWLSLLSRGWKKSKTLLIPHSKRQLDISKREYFKSVEATYRATHTYSKKKTLTGRSGEIDSKPFKKLEMPQMALDLKMSYEYGLKLALIPEYLQQEALRKCKDLGKDGWMPDKPERYFAGLAINLAMNQGVKLDWRSYYRTINAP